MGTRDLKNGISVVSSLAPLLRKVTATGTGVDTLGFDSAMAVVDVGAGTDGKFDFTLQESDALATGYTTVAAANLEGAFVSADAEPSPKTGVNTITRVGYKGNKRYIRVVATESSGTSPVPATGINFGAQIVLGHAHRKPVS